jgi:uncharacterized membrane protein
METTKKIILGTLILAVFTFIVAASSLYVQTEIQQGNVCGCIIPLPLFLPFLASVGLFIGTLIYYLFSPRFEIKQNKKDFVVNLLDLLGSDESKIIRVLIDNNCELSQAKIAKLTNLNKVKVFRILENLRKRNIIEKQKRGKTNIIVLNEKIRKLFD